VTTPNDVFLERALEVAEDSARSAGRILVKRRTWTREIKVKGLRDIVTDADFAANKTIHGILERAFPTHAILSEEDPHPDISLNKSEFLWIVDPLDGTTNYSRGFPVFSVSVALSNKGQGLVGVVYDPLLDECFYATRGGGAFLNGAKIQASLIAKLEQGVLGFELAREQELRERGLNWFAQLSSRTVTARIGGSAALSICYVGAGRLDAYMHLSLSPWDIAAAILIAREAGARVTHLDGRAATLRGGGYLAGNRKIFPALIRAVRELEKTPSYIPHDHE
jgi:myo-inositol-1(or 4)-monophosphatase